MNTKKLKRVSRLDLPKLRIADARTKKKPIQKPEIPLHKENLEGWLVLLLTIRRFNHSLMNSLS